MKKQFVVLSICILFFVGCSSLTPKGTVTQTSTIDVLLAGVYDGDMTCGELLKYGNFGIGTFDRLDGEMIVLDGDVFQVKSDGQVYRPDKGMKTPFASVCHFAPDETIKLKRGIDYTEVQQILDEHITNNNLFYAVMIRGIFSKMHTRSVPAQQKPYPPLATVTENQPEFTMENISGTIVGFRCPSYVKGINVPGYHMHFISDDFKQGGHILDFELDEGEAKLDMCNKFMLILPKNVEALRELDLSLDRSEELEKVEK